MNTLKKIDNKVSSNLLNIINVIANNEKSNEQAICNLALQEYASKYFEKQNILKIEDAYELYISELFNNFDYYLNNNKVFHISKYINFNQTNCLYLINKENLNAILNEFIERLKEKNFRKKYYLENNDIATDEIINTIKNIELKNIDYDQIFSLICNIYEQCYQVVCDVLNKRAQVISNDLLKNNDIFNCLYSYENIKTLIEKEEKKEVLVIVPNDILGKLSDIDILDENVLYSILYKQNEYQFEFFYEPKNDLKDYKIIIEKIN